jgi:uncharacterized membrane protein required for colicin V production
MNNADLVIAVLLLAGFLVGFFEGSPRALLAFGGWFLTFIAASHLREPLGSYLATNGTPYAEGFPAMLAFGGSFIVIFVLVIIGITFTYKDTKHMTRFSLADEFVGGVLGALVVLLLVTTAVIVLDSFYTRGGQGGTGTVAWIDQTARALDGSGIANALRSSLIPGLGAIMDPLLPSPVRAVMH